MVSTKSHSRSAKRGAPAAAKPKHIAAKPAAKSAATPNPSLIVKTHLAQHRWKDALSMLEADSTGTANNPRMLSFHAAALRSGLRDSQSKGNWSAGLDISKRALSLGLISAASSAATASFAASAAQAHLAKGDHAAALDILEPIMTVTLIGDEAHKALQRPIIKLGSMLGRASEAGEMERLLKLLRGQSAWFTADVERTMLKSLYSNLKDLARTKNLFDANALVNNAVALPWSAESSKTLGGIVGTLARLAITEGNAPMAASLLESLSTMAPGQIEADTLLARQLRADSTRKKLSTALMEGKCAAAYMALARKDIWNNGLSPEQWEAKEGLLKESLAKSASEIAKLRTQVSRLQAGNASQDAVQDRAAGATALNGGKLSEAQRHVLNEMETKGICRISFDEFFGAAASELWETSSAWMDEFSSCDALKEYMQAFSTEKDTIVGSDKFRKDRPNKLFEFNRADYGRPLTLDEPCMKIGLRPEVLDIAAAYQGTVPKMRSAVSWVHVPMFPNLYPRQASQQWHRDQEDGRILKLFTLFSDVDIDTGPFEYVPESTPGGRYAGVWDFNYKTGKTGYPPPGHVEKMVPPEDRYIAVCKRGTLVFVDTAGLHRGGYVTLKPRVATQTTYLRPDAPARILQNTLYKPSEDEAKTLTKEQIFAMT